MNIKTGLLLIIGIWIGLVFGLSFIEAPLKFQAPGITTALGLGIGKLVFGMSNKIQMVFFFLLITILILKRIKNIEKFIPVVLIISSIVLFQSLYMLPILDDRAVRTINGETVSKSYHHITFVLLEIIKLISLTTLFFKIQTHG